MRAGARDRILLGSGVLMAAAGLVLGLHGAPWQDHAGSVSGAVPPLTAVGPAPAAVAPAAHAARPVRLLIPAIHLDRHLIELGLNRDGTLATPPLAHAGTPGWYRRSPTPGNVGPAVIAGHVDSETGPAVFYDLSTLRPGDRITVERSDHLRAVFTVTRVQAFTKAHFPTAQVYGRTHVAALRLITCGGPYLRSAGGYQDNTVVFADLSRLVRI